MPVQQVLRALDVEQFMEGDEVKRRLHGRDRRIDGPLSSHAGLTRTGRSEEMSPQIAGMLKAAATLISAAEAGDRRVTDDYLASARTYTLTLLSQYRNDPDLKPLLETSPCLARLQAELERAESPPVLH